MKKLTGVALLLAAILFVAAVLLVGSWSASGPAEKSTAVVVAEGTSLSAASKELEAVGVIASADRFLLLAKLLGGTAPIQAGEYEFPAGASPSAVLATMQAGQTLRRFITIP